MLCNRQILEFYERKIALTFFLLFLRLMPEKKSNHVLSQSCPRTRTTYAVTSLRCEIPRFHLTDPLEAIFFSTTIFISNKNGCQINFIEQIVLSPIFFCFAAVRILRSNCHPLVISKSCNQLICSRTTENFHIFFSRNFSPRTKS